MDLNQLLIFLVSAVAIAFVILANRLITGARTARINGRDAALRRFRLDFPGFECGAALISADLKAALLAPEQPGDGHIGLVHVMGDKLITRLLDSGDIAGAKLEPDEANGDGPALDLHLKDLSLPRVRIPLGDGRQPHEAEDWLARLDRLTPTGNLVERKTEVDQHGN